MADQALSVTCAGLSLSIIMTLGIVQFVCVRSLLIAVDCAEPSAKYEFSGPSVSQDVDVHLETPTQPEDSKFLI